MSKPERSLLILDPDAEQVQLFVSTLAGFGWPITALSQGRDGWAELERRPPLLLILSMILPDVDPFEVLERVRREHPRTRVVATHPHPTEEEIFRAHHLGCEAIIPHPVIPQQLANLARALLFSAIYRGDAVEPGTADPVSARLEAADRTASTAPDRPEWETRIAVLRSLGDDPSRHLGRLLELWLECHRMQRDLFAHPFPLPTPGDFRPEPLYLCAELLGIIRDLVHSLGSTAEPDIRQAAAGYAPGSPEKLALLRLLD